MAFSPGRNVGRVSIRVVPDTKRFRPDLKRQLETIERTTSMTIRVDKAKVNSRALKDDIQRQLNDVDMSKMLNGAQVTVDKAEVSRKKLQESIQQQISRFDGFKANLAAQVKDKEKFEREVRRMVDRAERNNIDIPVSVTTAIANARLAYTARTRVVTLVVNVSKASVTKTLATLAALSGARLTWQWIDDLADMARNLDKQLPSIVMWTSNITALIAALAGSVSGLIGIGQGLFSITPAFLVLPGLILNAVGSLTVLFVALRHAKDELSALSGDMNELGDIIRTTFWDNARQPILNLVQGLMPQLRNSFRELSTGVGEFTAALANAFGKELANGRLESIFSGIAEGWRILGTGAEGFAGALVSLSQIAATYTPRLAGWFVRQANTFDTWLNSISNDGRLGAWMEGAIDSMYDLWSATTGFAGVLQGIWRAADTAGSGGLKGFAEMLQEWKDITNGSRFQTGLAAVFRGSYVAMDAFGGAISSLGDLIADMPDTFERFIGGVGGFVGGLLDETFQALNNSNFKIGLDGFTSGLQAALAGITPSLQPIANTFGSFLGTLGDIAAHILPAATGALANLTPALDAVAGAIEPVLPTLGDALLDISNELGPALGEFVEAASPLFQSVVSSLAESLVELAPVVSELVSGLADVVGALSDFTKNNEGFFDDLKQAITPDADKWKLNLDDVLGGAPRKDGFILPWFDDAAGADAKIQAQNWANSIAQSVSDTLRMKGPEAARAMLDGLNSVDIPADLRAELERRFGPDFANELNGRGREGGGSFVNGVTDGVLATVPGLNTVMSTSGANAIEQLRQGVAGGKGSVLDVFRTLPPEIQAQIPPGLLYTIGQWITEGLANGIGSKEWMVVNAASRVANAAVTASKRVLAVNSPSKRMEQEVGRWIPAGVARGIDKYSHLVTRSASAMADISPFGDPDSAGGAALGGRGNQINVTMPLLPGETPQEQRDNLVKELQWAF